MKKFYILIGVLAGIAVAMLACKKDSEPVANSANPNPPETQAVLDRVNAFRSQIEYYKANPAVKDGETENIDDAIWDIEALFNFTYAYPELSYSRTVSYDTTLYLPVNDKQVLLTDLTVFYGQMYEAISDLYHKTELSDKQFLILDVEAGELHGNTLSVNLHTVQGSVRGIQPPVEPPVQWMGPFEEGERWHFGWEQGGSNGEEGNAATKITEWINRLITPKAHDGFFYQYIHVITKESFDAEMYPFSHDLFSFENKFCEFCFYSPSFEDEWLDSDQLNFHFWGERHLVLNELPNQVDNVGLVPPTHSFFEINIEPMCVRQGDGYQKIYHVTTAKYGEKILVGTYSINRAEL